MAGEEKPVDATDGGVRPEPAKSNSGSRNRFRNRRGNKGAGAIPKESLFTGRCDGLKNHVYDCLDSRRAADQFTTTTKELANYVGRDYTHGDDVRRAIEGMQLITLVPPAPPLDTATKWEEMAYGSKLKVHTAREETLESNMKTLFSLIMGQCSKAMELKLQALPDYQR